MVACAAQQGEGRLAEQQQRAAGTQEPVGDPGDVGAVRGVVKAASNTTRSAPPSAMPVALKSARRRVTFSGAGASAAIAGGARTSSRWRENSTPIARCTPGSELSAADSQQVPAPSSTTVPRGSRRADVSA